MPEPTRRQCMAGVAALAGVRWEDEDIDPDDTEPLEGGMYTTGEFVPERVFATGESGAARWAIEDPFLTDRAVDVFCDPQHVNLNIHGEGDDIRAGQLAVLSAEQARQLGAALFQAGEELERRQDGGGDDE